MISSRRRVRVGFRVLFNPLWRGGINYVSNWVKACASEPAERRPEVHLLLPHPRAADVAKPLEPHVAGVHPYSDAAYLGLDCVFPVTHVLEAPFGAPWAGWIPDRQDLHMPDMFDAQEMARRHMDYGLLSTRAPLLVLSSQMAVDDTRRLYGGDAVSLAKLHFPALLDAASAEPARVRPGLPARFFIVCNQWWRHKDHRTVLDAMTRPEASQVHCVFTGETTDPRWPQDLERHREFIANRGLGARAHVLGSVERAEQESLLRRAVAIIQPSRFEGWSTVVEEARALSKPALVSDIPVHREQAPPHSEFFSPGDSETLARLMGARWQQPTSPLPPEEAAARQRNFVSECVANMVGVVRAAKAAYDPARHDPAVLLAELMPGLAASEDPVRRALHERAVKGARSVFSDQPEALTRFLSLCTRHDASYADRARREIAEVLLRRGGPAFRHRFVAARLGIPIPRWRGLRRLLQRFA